jgi:hypothetical protein
MAASVTGFIVILLFCQKTRQAVRIRLTEAPSCSHCGVLPEDKTRQAVRIRFTEARPLVQPLWRFGIFRKRIKVALLQGCEEKTACLKSRKSVSVWENANKYYHRHHCKMNGFITVLRTTKIYLKANNVVCRHCK